MSDWIAPLFLGIAFGVCLQRAGLGRYARIVNVYRFTDLTVLRFMLTAMVVGSVLVQAALSLGVARGVPVPQTFVFANVVGGVIFGVGMALAGFCPGTVLTEMGEGRLDAWIGGLAGLFAGGVAYGVLYDVLAPALRRSGAYGATTFARLLGASPWLVLLVFVEAMVLVLLLCEPKRPKRVSRAVACDIVAR